MNHPEANKYGANAFLSKPYDINDLFAVVKQFFSISDQTRKTKVALFPNNGENQSVESE